MTSQAVRGQSEAANSIGKSWGLGVGGDTRVSRNRLEYFQFLRTLQLRELNVITSFISSAASHDVELFVNVCYTIFQDILCCMISLTASFL